MRINRINSTATPGTLRIYRTFISPFNNPMIYMFLYRVLNDGSFDRHGLAYNVTAITNTDGTFNQEAYNAYSPLYLSVTFALAYGKTLIEFQS